MKLQAKSIFVLIGTLLIGIALGALGQSTMHNRRLEKLNEMRRQGGLYSAIDRYIDPVDQSQEDTLRALAKSYQGKLGEFYRHYQWHRSTLMDSLKTDMTPLLTPDQIIQIAPWFERSIRKPKSTKVDSSGQSAVMLADSTGQSEKATVPASISSN
jgi:hypothetical protein